MVSKRKSMNLSASLAKIQEILVQSLGMEKEIISKLDAGDLLGFERTLFHLVQEVFNGVAQSVLSASSERICSNLRSSYENLGLGSFKSRPLEIELHTGHRVRVPSLYAKRTTLSVPVERHLIARHWSVLANSSPLRLSHIGLCCALSPSYDIGCELVKNFGESASTTRVRNVVGGLAEHCHEREASLCLSKGETLEGRRAVVGVDGGRTRTRQSRPAEGVADGRKHRFDTPWCEPKMFVIQVLDDEGELDPSFKPIYGTRFSESDMLDLLTDYLHRLRVDLAREVEVVADGAPWIWNSLTPTLVALGVPRERIVEVLDHPHAATYLHELIAHMPRRVTEKQRKAKTEEFRQLLWEGRAEEIVDSCNTMFKRKTKEVQRWLNYFTKHKDRMQYARYEQNKWFCGSGIVESGIRRIINLRFKNPSTFWLKENVEKLFVLRAAALSKRWETLIQNIARSSLM
jgi:hypothetical protein